MSLRSRHKQPLIKYGWTRALFLFIVYLLMALVIGLVITWYTTQQIEDVIPPGNGKSYLWISASSILSILLVLFFRKYIDRRPLNSIGLKASEFFPYGVIGFLAGMFLVCMGSLVIYLWGGIEWSEVLFSDDIPISIFVLLLVSVSEELVFRGYILRNLTKSFNEWGALLISSVLFALAHCMNPGISAVGVINIFLGGMVLGITFIYTRSLWTPVLFHFSWNFFQGPVLGFPISGLSFNAILSATLSDNELLTGGTFGFEGSVVCTAMLLVTFSLLFFTRRFA